MNTVYCDLSNLVNLPKLHLCDIEIFMESTTKDEHV